MSAWEERKPLRVMSLTSPPVAGMLTGDELPAPLAYETREIYPVYGSHPMAVYELRQGVYSVMCNGSDWGRPYETTDLDLARVVCDRWAVEFASLLGGMLDEVLTWNEQAHGHKIAVSEVETVSPQ